MSKTNRRRRDREEEEIPLIERVIYINRVAKVVKGGRRFSFSAIVVTGDGKGLVGFGFGKANEVPEAIRKATEKAKRSMNTYPMVGATISNQAFGHFGSGRVLLKPASPGTGVIAGPVVRAVMETMGVHDVLTKSLGSTNPHNLVRATFEALEQLESVEQYAHRTGKEVGDVLANYTVRNAG
jgi:small subunit ribosomal protein S5